MNTVLFLLVEGEIDVYTNVERSLRCAQDIRNSSFPAAKLYWKILHSSYLGSVSAGPLSFDTISYSAINNIVSNDEIICNYATPNYMIEMLLEYGFINRIANNDDLFVVNDVFDQFAKSNPDYNGSYVFDHKNPPPIYSTLPPSGATVGNQPLQQIDL